MSITHIFSTRDCNCQYSTTGGSSGLVCDAIKYD